QFIRAGADQASKRADGAPVYHGPLRSAYQQWKADDRLRDAERRLALLAARFDYAVCVRREHALVQSKLGRLDQALANLEGLCDFETSRSQTRGDPAKI